MFMICTKTQKRFLHVVAKTQKKSSEVLLVARCKRNGIEGQLVRLLHHRCHRGAKLTNRKRPEKVKQSKWNLFETSFWSKQLNF